MLERFIFHHIGYAVSNIEDTAILYEDAGYSRTDTIYDPIQKVNICFLSKEMMPMIELIEPADGQSPINKTLEKNGVMPYHCCYEVDDINAAITDLRRMKYVPTSKPVPAIAINNRKVCFLYNKNVGLIELVEKN